MKTRLLRMTRRLWGMDYTPREINRANQLKWARSVIRLGDKWLLAQPVKKRQ
jgi:hypothetical protein